MKFISKVKTLKNNIIGYFTNQNVNDNPNKGLRVIPFSYINNKTGLDDFNWSKFVKAEFAIKDFDNLNVRLRSSSFTGNKTYIGCTVKPSANATKTFLISTMSGADRIQVSIFQADMVMVTDNNTLSQANVYMTNAIKTSLANGLTSFNFTASGTSNKNTSDDIMKILSCIHVYYKP